MMSFMDSPDSQPPNPLIRVNYLYFGVFLVILLFTSACSMLLKENMIGSRFFFLFYAFGQSIMEVGGFVLGAWVIRLFLGKICFWLFVGATFTVGMIHILDFFLDRVLDLSAFNTLGFIYDESFDNFVYLLEASGVSLWMWGFFFGLLACIPLLGMVIYKSAELATRRRPLFIRSESLLQALVCIPAALLFWDFSAARMIDPDAYTTFRKSLPWKQTFFQPTCVKFNCGKLVPTSKRKRDRSRPSKTLISTQ